MTQEEFFYQCIDVIEHWLNGNRKLSDLREVTDKLYNEVTKPHWISVEDDGNPIDTGWYIFTIGKIVDVGYYLGGNEWRDVHPTHWMPKPEAPTVAKNATVKEKGDKK